MKKLLVLCFIGASALTLRAQEDTKTLVKSLDPQNSSKVTLDFSFPVSGETWKEGTIRVLLDVTLENGNESVLKQLVQVGRYTVEGKKDAENNFVISVPGLKKDVNVRGVKMIENVKVTIFTPDGIEYVTTGGAAVKILTSFDKQLAAKGLTARAEPAFKAPFNCDVNLKAGDPSTEEIAPADILIDGKPLE